VEEEQLLLFTDFAMVAFGSFFEEPFVLLKLFLVGKADTVNTLK